MLNAATNNLSVISSKINLYIKIMPTINQLLRKKRVKQVNRNKVPALQKQPLKRGGKSYYQRARDDIE